MNGHISMVVFSERLVMMLVFNENGANLISKITATLAIFRILPQLLNGWLYWHHAFTKRLWYLICPNGYCISLISIWPSGTLKYLVTVTPPKWKIISVQCIHQNFFGPKQTCSNLAKRLAILKLMISLLLSGKSFWNGIFRRRVLVVLSWTQMKKM